MSRMRLAGLRVIVGLCLLTGGGSSPAFSQMEHMEKEELGEHSGH